MSDTDKLFKVTNRRRYTALGLSIWPRRDGLDYEDSDSYAWGESAQEVADRLDETRARPYQSSDYWRERFTDTVVAVVEVDADERRQQRRDRTWCLNVNECCDLAVIDPYCVCMIRFTCPVHGGQCHGTHD